MSWDRRGDPWLAWKRMNMPCQLWIARCAIVVNMWGRGMSQGMAVCQLRRVCRSRTWMARSTADKAWFNHPVESAIVAKRWEVPSSWQSYNPFFRAWPGSLWRNVLPPRYLLASLIEQTYAHGRFDGQCSLCPSPNEHRQRWLWEINCRKATTTWLCNCGGSCTEGQRRDGAFNRQGSYTDDIFTKGYCHCLK